MQTIVQKWGNSLGIRIPALLVKDFSLRNGSAVDIREEEGKIIIVPRKLCLEDLLSGITEDNRHAEVDSGTHVGNESW